MHPVRPIQNSSHSVTEWALGLANDAILDF